MSPSRTAPEITVDRTSPIPLYYQISEPLRQMILDGTLGPGTHLEDELTMAKRLGVSRPTARRALQSLVDLGLVIRRRAVGTIVAPKAIHRNIELSSLFEDLERDGQKPSTRVLEYEERPADKQLMERLQVPFKSPLIYVRRLRFAGEDPLAIMTNYLPPAIAPTRAELEEHGLYEMMREKGAVVHTAQQRISARRASAPETRLLDEPRGSAVLVMDRLGSAADGTPIEYGTHIYRASHYAFTLTLNE